MCCGIQRGTENDPRSGHPKTLNTDEQADDIQREILDERRLTVQQTARVVISGSVRTLLSEILGMSSCLQDVCHEC